MGKKNTCPAPYLFFKESPGPPKEASTLLLLAFLGQLTGPRSTYLSPQKWLVAGGKRELESHHPPPSPSAMDPGPQSATEHRGVRIHGWTPSTGAVAQTPVTPVFAPALAHPPEIKGGREEGRKGARSEGRELGE